MVKIIDKRSDIIRLWQEAFGDTKEDIEFFIDNIKNGICLGYCDGGIPVSMLYLVDCTVNDKSAEYVYAACTEKKSRGKGYMATLLEFAKSSPCENLCLIPANEGLVDYYKKQGLEKETDIKNIHFNECDEIKEYLFEGCELESPFALMYSKGE